MYDGPNEVKRRKAWADWEFAIVRDVIHAEEERWTEANPQQSLDAVYRRRDFWEGIYEECKTHERFTRT